MQKMSTFNDENTNGNVESSNVTAVKNIGITNSENNEFCEEFLRTFDKSISFEDESV